MGNVHDVTKCFFPGPYAKEVRQIIPLFKNISFFISGILKNDLMIDVCQLFLYNFFFIGGNGNATFCVSCEQNDSLVTNELWISDKGRQVIPSRALGLPWR